MPMTKLFTNITRVVSSEQLRAIGSWHALALIVTYALTFGAAPARAETLCETEEYTEVSCNSPEAINCFYSAEESPQGGYTQDPAKDALCQSMGFTDGPFDWAGWFAWSCPGYSAGCGASGGTAPCTFNGQTVSSGASVTAYQAQTVESPATCVSETRICTNGTLSGSYQYAACTVGGFMLRPDDLNQ